MLRKYATTNKTAVNVDLKKKVISNVIMAKVGEAKGHYEHIEQSFIDALVAYANTSMSDGVKCHFGHNYDNLGKTLGQFKNVRVSGDEAIGDLHFYESANDSPVYPDMANYILKQGAEDATAIMCSISYWKDYSYQKDEEGKEVKVWYYNEDGYWIRPNKDMKVYSKFKELKCCDIVDEGALTESLYSEDTYAAQLHDIVFDKRLPLVLDKNAESLSPIVDYFTDKLKPSFLTQIKDFFTPDGEEDYKAERDALQLKYNKIESSYAALKTTATEDKDKLQQNLSKISDLESELSAAKATIIVLENTPAEGHTTGETREEEPPKKPSYLNHRVNQKAANLKR